MTHFIFIVTALVAALVPAVASAHTTPASRTAWGNTCVSNITNDTGQDMFWQSEGHWATDTWQQDPSGTMIERGHGGESGDDTGGFMRGCHDQVVWVLDDAATITIDNTDPWSGGNSFTCQSSVPSKYQCTLDSSSVIDGPILMTNWTVNKVS
jgi:hypothetical protein